MEGGGPGVPFTLAEAARVRLAVYDVRGREVAVLADGRFGPRRHEVVFDGAQLPSGTYVIEARLGEAPGQGPSVTVTIHR